jgi:glycosyltransferase involved in cell wall biosynthesis
LKKSSKKLLGIEGGGAACAGYVQRAAHVQLILIPSYNSGAKLCEAVAQVRAHGHPVWVVIDGSTDGSDADLARRFAGDDGLKIFRRARNGGKGAAVLDGLRAAARNGFSHVLVMDSDGQHPASSIPEFLALSRQYPEAMILGVPVFDETAPWIRVAGRRLCNVLTRLETGGAIGDSLFGFRVYPVGPLLSVMEASRWMRGFDFDAEAAVRLSWRGVRALNRPAPVRYFRPEAGGVSHFRYGRDNAVLAVMHIRLLASLLISQAMTLIGREGMGCFVKTRTRRLGNG